ncbi:hypothetical protein [Aminobacter phage Erebus]|nr:hypothetical protein [Aminobacter phage Erebus]
MEIKKVTGNWFEERNASLGRRGPPEKYPFRTIPVGQVLEIKPEEMGCTFESFRVMTSTKSRELKKKFHCRLREDGVVEVYRSA